MSNYLVPKLIFDAEKIKIGYFIEINNVTDPLEESRRGIIINVREDSIEYMTGQRIVGKVTTSEVEDLVLEIKVTKRLNTSTQFISEVISHVEIENLPERELRLVLDKRFSNPYDRVKINGVLFVPIITNQNVQNDIKWYVDSTPESTKNTYSADKTGPKE